MPLWLDKTQYARVSNGDADSSSRESRSFLDASSFRQNIGSIRFLWIHGVLGVFWIIAFSSLLFLRSRPHADTLSYPDLTSTYSHPSISKNHQLTSFCQRSPISSPFIQRNTLHIRLHPPPISLPRQTQRNQQRALGCANTPRHGRPNGTRTCQTPLKKRPLHR